jgi:subtilisin-like proprotein convertase family protein
LALALAATLALAGAAEAKKSKAKNVSITNAAAAPIPDAAGSTLGQLDSTIEVGSKFKGLKIRDVNVTVQTTGSAAASGGHLIGRLTSPKGGSLIIFFQLATQSIGPLTLDDESPRILFSSLPPPQSSLLLYPPYAGSAEPGNSTNGKTLALMDNENVRGTWVLTIFDATPGATSVLNSWTLDVRTGKRYKTE